MTRLIAPECNCRYSTSMGEKKPDTCKHGNRYVYANTYQRSAGVGVEANGESRNGAPLGVDSSAPRRRSRPMRRSEPKRDWTLARAKIDEEGGLCRVCAAFSAEAAHILGRKYDQPISPGSKTLLVLPDRIVPLCSELTGHGCHARYDAHELDLLPYLTAAEQAQAVLDAGSMGLALKRISPTLEMAA